MKSFFQFYENLKLIKEEKYESRKDVAGYIDADKLIGERVWVHTNRTHRNDGYNGMIGIYSTTEYGKKTGNAGRYTNEIRLKSPIVFQTSRSGAKRIQQNDKRELIAGVSGVVIPTNRDVSGMHEITYNPRDVGYFHIINDPEKKEILTAEEIYFVASEIGEYKIFAKFKEPEDNESQIISPSE